MKIFDYVEFANLINKGKIIGRNVIMSYILKQNDLKYPLSEFR